MKYKQNRFSIEIWRHHFNTIQNKHQSTYCLQMYLKCKLNVAHEMSLIWCYKNTNMTVITYLETINFKVDWIWIAFKQIFAWFNLKILMKINFGHFFISFTDISIIQLEGAIFPLNANVKKTSYSMTLFMNISFEYKIQCKMILRIHLIIYLFIGFKILCYSLVQLDFSLK